MALNNLFRRRKKKLYFALVVADKPTEGFKFEADQSCQVFMVTGDVQPKDVIPRTVLKEVVERFSILQKPEGDVTVLEKKS